MLTSLNFLSIGKVWPPEEEKERLETYEQNRKIFENKHSEIYSTAFKRIQRVIGNWDDVISYETILNFQKKISLKTADFLFIEEPVFKSGEEGSREQKTLDDIIDENELNSINYQVGIDVSRYGTGLYNIYSNGNKGEISISPPACWFPIVDPVNIKKIKNHVLAKVYSEEFQGKKYYYLSAQIHYQGYYDEIIFNLKEDSSCLNYTIKSVKEEKRINTGLSGFAVIPVHNLMTSDRYFGIDDYQDVDSIISGIMVRIGQIDKILDEHAGPTLAGPMSALEQDPNTGEYKLTLNRYHIMDDKEDPLPEYITWDGKLSDSFTQIEKLVNFLCVISEMGTAIFDNAENLGAAVSGTALRLRYINPLTKTARLRMSFTPALKKALKLCSELGAVKLDSVSITWQDGLPTNSKEDAEIMQIRTGNKPTMSQKRALITYDSMSEEEAESELELIGNEDTQQNPVFTPFAENNSEETEEEPEE